MLMWVEMDLGWWHTLVQPDWLVGQERYKLRRSVGRGGLLRLTLFQMTKTTQRQTYWHLQRLQWQRRRKDKYIDIYSVYDDKDNAETNILTFTAITMTKTTQRQIYWHLQRLQWRRRRKDKYIDIYSVCNDKDDAKTNILKFTIIYTPPTVIQPS